MTLELVRLRVTCVQILHACHPVHRLVEYRRRLGWHTALGHGRNRCAWRSNESEPQRGVQPLTVTTLTRGSIGALQRHEHDRARPHGPHALRVQVVAAHAGGVHPAVAQGPAARAPRQAAPLHKLKKRRLYLLDDLTRLRHLMSALRTQGLPSRPEASSHPGVQSVFEPIQEPQEAS